MVIEECVWFNPQLSSLPRTSSGQLIYNLVLHQIAGTFCSESARKRGHRIEFHPRNSTNNTSNPKYLREQERRNRGKKLSF